MSLEQRLQNVAVLGAGGKMGSGISLLLAREMTLEKIKPENAGKTYELHLIDVNPEALEGLKQYLHKQAIKFVQKKADKVQPLYQQAGKNLEGDALAAAFAEDMQSILRPTTDVNTAAAATMVFEAIIENVDIKTSVLKQLGKACSPDTFFFSNTSSIPIHILNEKAELGGRIIGFHFYNPPAVQKLVEIIVPDGVNPDLPPLAEALGKRLGKILIPSNDVAGFIGNGHFMRDGLHGIAEAQRLQETYSFVQSIYMMNRVSQDFLIRPMGIFQLIDYVGLDVFQAILNIMNPHFPDENLHSDLIDELVKRGVKGGQYSDGSQKDGFLKYEGGKIVGVYDLNAGEYVGLESGDWKQQADAALGPLPEGHLPWKAMLKEENREEKLKTYFTNLRQMDTLGADLARRYLKRSKEIGLQLVEQGVANKAEDVNGVLMYGFYHLYGPINDYID